MSESDGEHAARSVALEQAYVHEVYEQCAEKTTQSKHWPRVYQFLQELEPGALVCDIGQSAMILLLFSREMPLQTNPFYQSRFLDLAPTRNPREESVTRAA